MSKRELLQKLDSLITLLEHDMAQQPDKIWEVPCFNQNLFNIDFYTKQTKSSPYLDEIKSNYHKLSYAVAHNQYTVTQFLAERLFSQITAVRRHLISYEPFEPNSALNDLQKTIVRYTDYEQRLTQYIEQYEQRLIHAQSPDKYYFEQQLARLEGKLYRCQQAIKSTKYKLECYLSNHNKRNH